MLWHPKPSIVFRTAGHSNVSHASIYTYIHTYIRVQPADYRTAGEKNKTTVLYVLEFHLD